MKTVIHHPDTRYGFEIQTYRTGVLQEIANARLRETSALRPVGTVLWLLRKRKFHNLNIYLRGWRCEPNFYELVNTGHGVLQRCGYGFTRYGAYLSLMREARRAYRQTQSGSREGP